MSTNLPIRAVRIPAFRRQCLFQHHPILNHPPFSPSTPRAISSTPSRLARSAKPNQRQDKVMTQAATQYNTGPAPRVNFEKAQKESGMLADDIGLLQDTVVRAALSKLPAFYKPAFWGYLWKFVKSKGTGWYSRSAYNRCMYKTGWSRWRPVDMWEHKRLATIAQKHYADIYTAFAKGDMAPIQRVCLPPLTRDFKNRLIARGPLIMNWTCKNLSARVVSHRAAPLGDEQPDTAYRQVVVRLSSNQTLAMSGARSASSSSDSRSPPTTPSYRHWVPEEAKIKLVREMKVARQEVQVKEGASKPTRVVEYLVLQNRVINRIEEDWKVWGFTEESTPAKIEDDAAYWRKQLNAQAAAVA